MNPTQQSSALHDIGFEQLQRGESIFLRTHVFERREIEDDVVGFLTLQKEVHRD